MRSRAFFLLLLAVLCSCPPVHARLFDASERERAMISLSDGWSYALDPMSTAPRDAWASMLPSAQPITLPHRWQATPETRGFHGTIWYAREFTLPEKLGSAGALLVIDHPVGALDVYLDGKLLTQFAGNGLTRRLQVTGTPGVRHVLTLRLSDSSLPGSIGRTASCGIGEIGLQSLPSVRLDALYLSFSQNAETLTVRYRISSDEPCRAELFCKLLPMNDPAPLARLKKPVSLVLPAGTTDGVLSLPARKLKRWSPDAPQLYRLSAEIVVTGGKTRDSYQLTCAPVNLSVSEHRQLAVNGTYVILRGLRLPGGLPPDPPRVIASELASEISTAGRSSASIVPGIPLTKNLLALADQTRMTELLLMRRAGYTALMAEGPALSESVLQMADYLGMMVIVEIPPTWITLADGSQSVAPDIQATLEALAHHPCVVAWYWPTGATSVAGDIKAIRALDPVRPLIVRTGESTVLYSPSHPAPLPVTEFDLAAASSSEEGLASLQQAEQRTAVVLLSGTLPATMPPATLAAQADEQARLSGLRLAVESVLLATHPLGYFVRPTHSDTYTGLMTTDGSLTQAYYAATDYNAPSLLAVRVQQQRRHLLPNVIFINGKGLSGKYQLSCLLTTPGGWTDISGLTPQTPLVISDERREEFTGRTLTIPFPPLVINEAGLYRVQFILSQSGKVIATSQVVFITAENFD